MKPYYKFMLASVALLAIAAVGTQYYETLPGLVIKHPVTGAVTAHINGTNGTVTAGPFVGTGYSVTLLSLTPADAGVSLDFSGSPTAMIDLTGAVTFASSSLAAGTKYHLRIRNPQATNCAFTWPTHWTNWLGSAPPGAIAAGKVAEFEGFSWETTDAGVFTQYAEKP